MLLNARELLYIDLLFGGTIKVFDHRNNRFMFKMPIKVHHNLKSVVLNSWFQKYLIMG